MNPFSPRPAAAIALLLCCVAPRALEAQLHPLTDDDVRRAMPVLQAMIDAKGAMAGSGDQVEGTVDRMLAVIDSVEDGTIDPMQWIRSQAPDFIAPPGGTYDARCSVTATSREGIYVAAVFALGEGERLGALGREEVALSDDGELFYRLYAEQYRAQGMSEEAIRRMVQTQADVGLLSRRDSRDRTLTDAAAGFYEQGGYRPRDRGFAHPRDANLRVDMNNQVFALDRCRHLGPQATVQVSYTHVLEGMETFSSSIRSSNSKWESAHELAGWSRPEWDGVLKSLRLAAADTSTPLLLQSARPADASIRRANAEVYRRHAAQIDPLLRAM